MNHDERWAAEQRRLGCPSCRRGDCARHQHDFEVGGVALVCRHGCKWQWDGRRWREVATHG